MEGLQRSTTSFRRQGSSGLVWDDKALSGELNQKTTKAEAGEHGKMQRSRSAGAGAAIYTRTIKVPSPDNNMNPPSPRVSGCCGGIFGSKPSSANKRMNRRRPKKTSKR